MMALDLAPAPSVPPVPTPAAPTQPTLLIVDDEDGPRQSLRMVFRHDFVVHTVENGDKALDYARQNPVHVAILDIRMAGKSGIDVLRGLKGINPQIEVIMLTAYETIETARQALRLGACDYLSKPFDLSTIRDAVTRALHLRRISETMSSAGERLDALSEQLKDASVKEEIARTTTEIYAGALHDIKNPLTVITGYVDLLRFKLESVGSLYGADLQAIRQDVEILSKQVNTCGAITRRYLRFANRRAGVAPEVRVNQVLDDVHTLMRNHPALRGGRLSVKPLNRDVSALIGGTELIQILLNLTINAFQAGAEGQEVWIAAERHDTALDISTFHDSPDERCLHLASFNNTGPVVALSVLDQGPGIAGDVLARIFEPYFTTKEQEGSGLGLAIVSRFVKNHNGLLHVKTRLGEGTRFTLYLPGREPRDSGTPFTR